MARLNAPVQMMEFDIINDIISLDGPELLHKLTLTLHEKFSTQCSCIVEIDTINNTAQTLSFACGKEIRQQFSYSLADTPCDMVRKSNQAYCIYTHDITGQFPRDVYLQNNDIEAYIGVPLKSRNGDILGILLSTFTHPIEESNELIDYHKMFANLAMHSLRSKWLSARSKSLVNQLSHEVSHDNLTGLHNRGYLSNQLERLSDTQSSPFTLAYIDIDDFKSINDLYGNYIGDQVIKFVGKTVQDALPDHHHAYRIAGDEFAFITFSSDPLTICQKIIAKLNEGYQDSSHSIKINVSIGLARKADHRLSADQIILHSSLALKDCKQSSNEKIKNYDTHLSKQYHRETMVIDALRNELDRAAIGGEIYVLLQPIVDRDSYRWDHFEILARWKSESLGAIYPGEFIEAAEQSGLIVELGERIVELACQAKKELEKGLGYKVHLSINCSAHELADSARYTKHLTSTIARYHYTPDEFTIELTETVLLSQTNEARYLLDKLRNQGFTIALDDFGTGYSSLKYIHNYPIDCIKIDASFIDKLLYNETSELLVSLIIQLANQLGVKLVAEGVESEEVLQKLYQMGCTLIQGYYFSRPETPLAIISHHSNIQSTLRNVGNA